MNLAVQVLSHSAAAGISALITLKHLPDSAKDTAQSVEHFDGLFNTFNSQLTLILAKQDTLGRSYRKKRLFNNVLMRKLDF